MNFSLFLIVNLNEYFMEAKKQKKQKILVVDDSIENIRIIGSILRENAFQVGFATSGQQALDILNSREEEYDLVLLDVNMPGSMEWKYVQ